MIRYVTRYILMGFLMITTLHGQWSNHHTDHKIKIRKGKGGDSSQNITIYDPHENMAVMGSDDMVKWSQLSNVTYVYNEDGTATAQLPSLEVFERKAFYNCLLYTSPSPRDA